MKKIILVSALAAMTLFAANDKDANPLSPQNFRPLNEMENLNDNGVTNDLKIKKFYLDIDKDEVKEVQKRDKDLKEIFDEFDESIVNYKPFVKPISTVDKITTHPYFTTTILLPAGSVISSIDMSIEPITLKYEQNTILLRVKNDFRIANLTAIYSLDKKNYVANFLIERYDRANTDEKLNLVLDYKNIKRLDDFEVVQIYRDTYHKDPTDKYNYIEIDGIFYRIIREDRRIASEDGYIFIQNKPYRIDVGNAL